jgi:uncharacterized protein
MYANGDRTSTRLFSVRRVKTDPLIETVSVTTVDGVDLVGLHRRAATKDVVIVVGHGFTNSIAKPSSRAAILSFALPPTDDAAVIAFDFRGHGRSGGTSTVGMREHRDLDAAIDFARQQGYRTVVSVGFSMGGSIALIQAATGVHKPDIVVSISSPSTWFIRETAAMKRVHWILEHPLGPWLGRRVGVRLDKPWAYVPPTPLEMMDRIAPIPLLLVHGTDDHYFWPQHAIALQNASMGHAELWLEPGMAHAETGTNRVVLRRVRQWIARQLVTLSETGPATSA